MLPNLTLTQLLVIVLVLCVLFPDVLNYVRRLAGCFMQTKYEPFCGKGQKVSKEGNCIPI